VPQERQRTVITGGAGFIGSHLCDHFVEKGHEVICLDNLLTGAATNVEHLLGRENFTFIKYDVSEYIHVGGRVDNVLHFASPASPVDYLEYPIETLKVGAMGTHKALGLAKDKGAHFLLASTSECYGDPLVHPQSEDYWGNVNPVGPRGVYDEAKRFAEALTMAYHRSHGVDTRIARIFNTYGPRMRLCDGRALPTFFRQALTGEDLTVFGDGSQTRSLCYIADMVEGIALLLENDEHGPVNLGNPDEVTVLGLAQEILEVTGSRSRIVLKPLPVDDPKVRQPDVSKAKRVLGWEPRTPRAEGLRLSLDYFRKQVSAQHV
jgi:dTDP-glucose 4,6-dehydratase